MMTGPAFPSGVSELSPEWFGDRLGSQITAFHTEPVGVGIGVLGELWRITPQYAAGSTGPASLVVKIPPPGAQSRTLADSLHMGLREVRCYQRLGSSTPLTMPASYYLECEETTGEFVLLIEDLGDRRIVDQIAGCGLTDAETVIRGLSAHHAKFWNLAGVLDEPWLNRIADPPNPMAIVMALRASWPVMEQEGSDLMPGAMLDVCRQFSDHVVRLIEDLSAAPATLLHGDFRLDNMYFAAKPEHSDVVFGDWQLAMTGQGVYDATYFLTQSLADDVRTSSLQDLLRSYHDGLVAGGVSDYPWESCLRDFRRATLFHLCYPLAAGSMDLTTPRAVKLLRTMLERAVAAVAELDALEFF